MDEKSGGEPRGFEGSIACGSCGISKHCGLRAGWGRGERLVMKHWLISCDSRTGKTCAGYSIPRHSAEGIPVAKVRVDDVCEERTGGWN